MPAARWRLLQGNRTEPVWGQEIGTNDYPKLGGDKVYQSAPCPAGYSNTQGEVRQHNYVDGVCSLCGEHEPPKEVNGYYQITNQWQLYWFADQVSNKGQTNINAKLTADITLNSNVLNENGELNTGAGANFTPWTPIGTNTKPFTGTFDGNNKTISGLYINVTADYVGLFGCVGNGGTVKNVTLADSYVSGANYVGGICGQNKCGTLQNCHNNGKVSGAWYVGGVFGSNTRPLSSDPSSTIQECYNTGKVSGKDYVGGVCGQNNRATVEKSYNTNTVSGGGRVGGVCGENNYSGTVNGCYNTGDVSGTGFNVGGVCGYNYDDGTVKGTVENCYYLAGTSANAVGNGTDGVNCASKTKLQFQNGEVAFLLQEAIGTEPVWGQTIGKNASPVLVWQDDYQPVYKTAEDSPCKALPYCNTSSGILYHDYTTDGVCIRCGAWQEATPNGDYYEIHNQGQLRWFADQVSNKGQTTINARLMASFAMDGTEWTPIGTSNEHPFTGDFDGNGKTITGLKCTKPNVYDVGLVGYASKATIQNVTVKDSSFIGNERIGAVCGSIIDGKITGCTNSYSTVSGGFYNLGGIAGRAENTTVQRCFNSGAVTGKYSKIGGIVGYADYVTVQDCGNTGTVTMTDSAGAYYGGIIGAVFGYSTIENCYNTDSNTTAGIYAGMSRCDLSNCYYLPDDTSSSGSTGTDIIAKTQAQFNSGEVAYLLQNEREQAVWGQKIDTDDYPKLGGDKVYQSAPCKSEYTNTESKTVEHVFGSDGICEKCGQPQIAYTVTIPATVELGTTATIKAKDVILPNNKTLNVKVAEGSEFKVAQVDDNDAVVDKCAYTVTKGETKIPVNPSDTVLTAVKGESEKTVELQFNKPETTTYSGEYKGTVKFTVSVDDKPAS